MKLNPKCIRDLLEVFRTQIPLITSNLWKISKKTHGLLNTHLRNLPTTVSNSICLAFSITESFIQMVASLL